MTAAEMGMAIGLSIGVIVFVMVGTVACYFYLKTRERYRDLAWWRLALLAFGMIQGLLSAFGIVLLIVFRGAEDFSDLVSEWLIGSVWTATILFAGLCFTREARQKPGVVSASLFASAFSVQWASSSCGLWSLRSPVGAVALF